MKVSGCHFLFSLKKESNQRKKSRLGYLLRTVCALAGTVAPEDSRGRIRMVIKGCCSKFFAFSDSGTAFGKIGKTWWLVRRQGHSDCCRRGGHERAKLGSKMRPCGSVQLWAKACAAKEAFSMS
jgi:hypothetical protein